MDIDVTVLLGPPWWSRILWAVFGAQLVWMVFAGPSISRILAAVGTAMVAAAWNRHLRSRGLWLTQEEVVIGNSTETHIVPKAGASTAFVEEEFHMYNYRSKPNWDNTITSTRRLYVIPGGSMRDRIHVEAAQGVTPRKIRKVIDALDMSFKEAS